MSYLSAELQQCLREADDRRCAYCQTAETNTGHPMTVDHITPRSHGGLTIFDNLCFACRSCNQFKGQTMTATDPLTGKIVPLYHPRQQAIVFVIYYFCVKMSKSDQDFYKIRGFFKKEFLR